MKGQFSEEERAEAFSRCIDQMNEGKVPNLEELGDLGKEIASLVETALLVRKTLGVIKPLSEEEMERGFARVNKRYEELVSMRAFAEAVNSGKQPISLERRSDFLILLLHYAKQIWGNVKLVKLLFLMWNEGELIRGVGDFYSHYAYNFGAFDEDIPKDVKALTKLGVIDRKAPPQSGKGRQQVDAVYQLTPKGEVAARKLIESAREKYPGLITDIKNIVEKFGKMNTAELLSYTYTKYPDYAKNSKVKDKYLG